MCWCHGRWASPHRFESLLVSTASTRVYYICAGRITRIVVYKPATRYVERSQPLWPWHASWSRWASLATCGCGHVQGASSIERREEHALATCYDFEVAVILHAPDGVARTCGSSIMICMLFRSMLDNKESMCTWTMYIHRHGTSSQPRGA
jgi:hypothetical protein